MRGKYAVSEGEKSGEIPNGKKETLEKHKWKYITDRKRGQE